MSIPRDHHYLPQFYIDRWARDGKVFRYVRPRGKDGPIDCKRKPPKAIAYQRDLYHQPDISDPIDSQSLELRFFQQIDDRAAKALQKLEQRQHGTGEDRIALAQFMISRLHRSPSRLNAMRAELAERTLGAPYENLEGEEFDSVLKSITNRLLAMLVESSDATSMIAKFKIFNIDVSGSSKTLLTSDRPIMVSAQLIAHDAFMMLPFGPFRLVLLTHKEAIARSFSSQNPDVLVAAVNQAVVEQSEDIVIAADTGATRMIERKFLRLNADQSRDSIGLIRRKSPLIDLNPKTRTFSRHDKKGMKYLGL